MEMTLKAQSWHYSLALEMLETAEHRFRPMLLLCSPVEHMSYFFAVSEGGHPMVIQPFCCQS